MRISSTKNNLENLNRILSLVGVHRMIKSISINNEITKIDRQEFNRYECIPCTQPTTKKLPIPWTKLLKNSAIGLDTFRYFRKIEICMSRAANYFATLTDEYTAINAVYFLKDNQNL